MLRRIIFIFTIFATLVLPTFGKRADVGVGGYLFPTFIYNDSELVKGISLDLIDPLNEVSLSINLCFI